MEFNSFSTLDSVTFYRDSHITSVILILIRELIIQKDLSCCLFVLCEKTCSVMLVYVEFKIMYVDFVDSCRVFVDSCNVDFVTFVYWRIKD